MVPNQRSANAQNQDPAQRLFKTYYKSPLGAIEIKGTKDSIVAVNFVDGRVRSDARLPRILKGCRKQIDEYFKGKRQTFSLDLHFVGTPFQKSVWHQLTKIPFGETASYGAIAQSIGSPQAFRAVGNANNRNPIAIIVPCHRIVGSNGHLIGYGGGLWRKEWLLEHEGNPVNNSRLVPALS